MLFIVTISDYFARKPIREVGGAQIHPALGTVRTFGEPLTPSPVPPTPDPPRSGNERSGGGGGLDATTLLALGLALFARRFRFPPCRPRQATRRTHRRA